MAPLKKRKREKTTWQHEMMGADVDTLRQARKTINDLLAVNDTVREHRKFGDYIRSFWTSCEPLRERIKEFGGHRRFYYERLIYAGQYDPIPCTIDTFAEFNNPESGCWCEKCNED